MRNWPFAFLLLAVLTATAPVFAQITPEGSVAQTARIETTYDSSKNKTTVRLAPVQISGEKDKYYSLHFAPYYSYSGQASRMPEIIDFELQTVVKARKLKIDLYVLFIVDGGKIFLSSNRWSVKRPVPGRPWVGERLVFRMPYETLLKITQAKQVEITMDGIRFAVGDLQLQALRDFAGYLKTRSGGPSGVGSATQSATQAKSRGYFNDYPGPDHI